MAEFVESKFWVVLPYALVRPLEQLMLSPAAVKEERERKPRLLCDHSWPWQGWPSVNDTTIPHAPPEAMQFGLTLPRLLWNLRHANPKYGPPRLAKFDIKDGFYRLFLRPMDCLRLAVLLPRYEGESQLVAVPLACTMGWVQSPPSFFTMSETVCDLANQAAAERRTYQQAHRLAPLASQLDDHSYSWRPRPREDQLALVGTALPGKEPPTAPAAEEPPAPPSNMPHSKPLGTTDVFVDDFIQITQGGK
jgi:hypothetical protein